MRHLEPKGDAMLDSFRKLFEAAEWSSLAELYADDALLDLNVPQWRYQRKGRDEIAGQWQSWYPNGLKVVEWNVWETPAGAVVEHSELVTESDGIERYARHVNIFDVADGLITRHIVYCTGGWDPETVERQRAEAPMYRP